MANGESRKIAHDLVDHIRLVHFGLIAACISLLIANHSQRTHSIHTAVQDIRRIESLASLLNADALKAGVIHPLLQARGIELPDNETKMVTLSAPERSELVALSVEYPSFIESKSLQNIYDLLPSVARDEESSLEPDSSVDSSLDTSKTDRPPEPADSVPLEVFRAIWDIASAEQSSDLYPSLSIAPKLKAGVGKFVDSPQAHRLDINKPLDLSEGVDITPELRDTSSRFATVFDAASNQARTIKTIDFEYDSVTAAHGGGRVCFLTEDNGQLSIRTWNAVTGNIAKFDTSLPQRWGAFRVRAQLAEDGKRVAWAYRSRPAQPYQIAVARLDGPKITTTHAVQGRAPLAFTRDGAVLAHCGKLGTGVFTAVLDDTSETKEEKVFVLDLEVLSMAPLQDRSLVVVGNQYSSHDGKAVLAVLDYTTGKAARLFEWSDRAVTAQLGPYSNGAYCFAAIDDSPQNTKDATITIYNINLQDGSLINKLTLSSITRLGSMSVLEDGSALAVSHNKGVTIIDGDLSNHRVYQQFGVHAEVLFYDAPRSLAAFQTTVTREEGLIREAMWRSDQPAVEGLVVESEDFTVDEPARDWLLFVPGETGRADNRIVVPLQEIFLRKAQADWKHGGFETSFPDLSRAAQDRFNLPIGTLRRALEKEAELAGDSVEPFGVPIPAWAVRRLGVLFLICIQFYFWRHLTRVSLVEGYDSMSVRSRWIGLYNDRLSIVAVVATAVVLPVITSFVLLWHQVVNGEWLQTAMSATVAVASAILGAVVLKSVVDLNWRARMRVAGFFNWH